MQQFFVQEVLSVGERVVLREPVADQLRKVLRCREGDQIRLIDGSGRPFLCALEMNKKTLSARVQALLEERRELPVPLILGLARIKKEHWEWALQKAAELGATTIVPLESQRVNERPISDHRQQRYERIVEEAAEQSERHRVPRLESACAPLELVRRYPEMPAIVLAERRGDEAPLLGSLLRKIPMTCGILLLIGPEGGWSSEEMDAFYEQRLHFASLGPRILRADTAAVLATGMAAQQMEGQSPIGCEGHGLSI